MLRTEISVLHRGTEEARRNESSFLAFDTTTKTNLLHALRGPRSPLRGRRQIFLHGKSVLGACFCAMRGGGASDDSAPGLASVLEDFWQQFRRQDTLCLHFGYLQKCLFHQPPFLTYVQSAAPI